MICLPIHLSAPLVLHKPLFLNPTNHSRFFKWNKRVCIYSFARRSPHIQNKGSCVCSRKAVPISRQFDRFFPFLFVETVAKQPRLNVSRCNKTLNFWGFEDFSERNVQMHLLDLSLSPMICILQSKIGGEFYSRPCNWSRCFRGKNTFVISVKTKTKTVPSSL